MNALVVLQEVSFNVHGVIRRGKPWVRPNRLAYRHHPHSKHNSVTLPLYRLGYPAGFWSSTCLSSWRVSLFSLCSLSLSRPPPLCPVLPTVLTRSKPASFNILIDWRWRGCATWWTWGWSAISGSIYCSMYALSLWHVCLPQFFCQSFSKRAF